MIHVLADVQTSKIGSNTYIWQYAIILERAVIGDNCNINCHTFIENDVKVGNNVTIKSGVYLWDGIDIDDNVFVGPNVTFTNDERPRSKQYPAEFKNIKISKNASIGAGAIILGGVNLGEYCMIGAGSLITKDVPARALIVGSPGKIVGWLNDDGTKMEAVENNIFVDCFGKRWMVKNNNLEKI
jgi:UDP-2-acetamido-3-amino-2,3-dideoxy-glucuronate N-acetyltransferase